MKAILASLCVLAISASAFAGSINYDFRGDYNSTMYNDGAGLPNFQKFYIKTGRLYFKGTLNERISYELRWGFYKPAVETATANAARDSLNSSVEFANITDKMSDIFALQAGKFSTELGGFEGAASGADLYMVTPNYGHVGAKTLIGKNLGINQGGANNLLYATGVKGDFYVADQHLFLVLADNQGDAVDAGGNFNQNRGLMGVIYKGAFMEKALTLLASYHEVSPQGAVTDGGNKHIFYAAGAKYDDASMFGTLEYNATDYKDGLSTNHDTLYSVLAKYGMKLEGGWAPQLNVFTGEEKIAITPTAAGTNRFVGYGAVLEYKPTADNFRYHVAYNMITTSPTLGGEQNRSEIVVGTRLFGDFLK